MSNFKPILMTFVTDPSLSRAIFTLSESQRTAHRQRQRSRLPAATPVRNCVQGRRVHLIPGPGHGPAIRGEF